MRVRMLAGLSGPAFNLIPGDEAEFPDAEALRLVSAGFAVPLDDAKVERATKSTRKVEKR